MGCSTFLRGPMRRLCGLFAAIMALAMLAGFITPQAAAADELFAADAEQVYFEQTGQVLGGVFLEAWENLGGMNRTGHPISPAIQVDDTWVQWFEYARLEVPAAEIAADKVTFAPAGSQYAERIGYKRWHPAFQGVAAAGEGARYFEDTRHSLANAMLNAWNNNDYESKFGQPISEEFVVGSSTYQFFERGAFAWSENEGIKIVPIGILDATAQGRLAAPQEKPAPAEVYQKLAYSLAHPGDGERWIDINLTTFLLTAYTGTDVFLQTPVVVGAAVSPTVDGVFHTYWKLESQTMSGVGWDGTPYYQEAVPWVMYFYQDFAIHGAYWRSGFGYAASHGCVNVPTDLSQQLWNWAPAGTRVVVHY